MFVNYRTTIWNQSTFAITRSQSHVSLHETVKPAGSVLSSLYVVVIVLLAHPWCSKRRQGGLMFCCCLKIFSWFQSHQLSQHLPDWPIFTKFAEFVELWPSTHDLKLFFFDPARNVAMATNFVSKIDLHSSHLVVLITFARAAPPA